MTDQLPEKKKRGANLKGRPKGVLNKETIFKQAMQMGFEERLQKDFLRVLDSVVTKAIGPPMVDKEGNLILDEKGNRIYCNGDMNAAKMLMDRVIPTSKAIDLDDLAKSKGLTISINVGSLEDKKAIEAQVIEDGEIIE